MTRRDREYLKTEHWAKVRRHALDDAGNKCSVCPAGAGLQVHHRTYDRIGHERPGDVVVLCDLHHLMTHWEDPDLDGGGLDDEYARLDL